MDVLRCTPETASIVCLSWAVRIIDKEKRKDERGVIALVLCLLRFFLNHPATATPGKAGGTLLYTKYCSQVISCYWTWEKLNPAKLKVSGRLHNHNSAEWAFENIFQTVFLDVALGTQLVGLGLGTWEPCPERQTIQIRNATADLDGHIRHSKYLFRAFTETTRHVVLQRSA